ncbi:hypothetical protein [uncultured Draconibacterium sp.]|uniref:hypothetical protein n=1 Tax=uncultured Draconibacterium sp. TaxID=1573823 RepID=UPI002AA70057|nr:hypothetical protein [uncultured Draconibacterium sp.]
MNFKYFNLTGFRKRGRFNSDEHNTYPARRKFVKTMGLGAIAWSPIVESVKTLQQTDVRFSFRNNELKAWLNNHLVWEISPKIFEHDYTIDFSQRNNSYLLKAKNLKYRSTDFHFSLHAIINADKPWKMELSIPELELSTKINFIDWLQRTETLRANGQFRKRIATINKNSFLQADGKFDLTLSPDWEFNFYGHGNVLLKKEKQQFRTDNFTLKPGNDYVPSYLKLKTHNATLVELNNFNDWPAFVNHIPLASGQIIHSGNNLPTLQFLLAKNNETIFLTEAANLSYFPGSTEKSHINFKQFFYFAEYLGEDCKTYLSASIAEHGNWIATRMGSFSLNANDAEPDFEAFGNADLISEVYFEPRLKAFKPRVINAVALNNIEQDPPKVRIQSARTLNTQKQDPPQKKNTKTQTLINQTTRILQDPPQRKVKKEQPTINLNISQLKFKPKQAIKIRVLRPEDLVLLEFTFHNFNYTNKGLSPFLELDNNKKPGVVVISFQSQHTLEEAYFEATEIEDTDELKPKDTGVRLPAKHMRANKSRLVYELPAGHEGFPVIMEELLDWTKYKLVVHPRAWMKLPSIRIIDKPLRLKQDTKATDLVNPNIKYLDSSTTEYGLKLAENTKIKANNLQVYQANEVSKVLKPQVSSTVKPAFQLSKIKNIDWIVGPVPDLNTCIEAPALLYISPNQTNDFYHKTGIDFREAEASEVKSPVTKLSTTLRTLAPISVTKGVVTELWHTRLGVKLKNGKTSGSTLQHLKTIRALWAEDANLKYDKPPNRNRPFMASLDANNRHKLVHTTSNYSEGFEPFPVPVNNLMLTTLGAYLDWHAYFDVPTPQDNVLNIIEWEHRATLGRDNFVKVVEEGYLFPFGHRAAVVKITERKFDAATKAAANRQRMFVVVLEKEVLYSRNDPEGKFIEFPFQAIRIETNSTPNIDNPATTSLDSNLAKTYYNFYINVASKGFLFDVVATDKEGEEHAISMPLVFVENAVARSKSMISKVIDAYRGKNNNNYNSAYNEVDFYGKEVAYAEFLIDKDTAFETERLKFDAQNYPVNAAGAIKFHPKMKEAKVYIQQISELTGIREPATIGLEDDDNDGAVFARVISKNVVDFSGGSDKAGGFLTPNMSVSGLSKLQGPVNGSLDNLKKLEFIPEDFFEAMDDLPGAKIFGVIDIISLLLGSASNPLDMGGSFNNLKTTIKNVRNEINDIKNEILYLENLAEETQESVEAEIANLKQQVTDKVNEMLQALNNSVPRIPNFKSYITEEAFYVEYKWQPELSGSEMSVIPGLLSVNVDNPKTALNITTKFEKPFNSDKPAALNGSARFEKFEVDIEPLLAVKFNYLEFRTGSTQKTDVKVDIDKNDPIKFKGVLNFVNNLQSIIPAGGFSDDGPYIDLKPTGVTAGFSISVPNVEVGICMISNISLGANVTLPFTGAPLTMGFNFCKRENPFMLTISCFGGGGYFMMVTSLKGLQSVEAAFEFGAAMSLNVGVASGGVSAMGGFYYKIELVEGVEETTLTGYLRLNGHLSVLGLISVSLEFYLAFNAVIYQNKVQKLEGLATLKVKVEVLFFSKTVSVTVRRELKGADADPKFIEMIDTDDWQEYCLAFAG